MSPDPKRGEPRLRSGGEPGLPTLGGELVLLLNSDVELTQGEWGSSRGVPPSGTGCGGRSALYVDPDGTPQPFHFRFPTFATTREWQPARRLLMPGSERRLRDYRMLDEDFSKPRTVPQPSASCLLLRRSCLPLEEVFDERYPIFFNDVQLGALARGPRASSGCYPMLSSRTKRILQRAGSAVRGRRQYFGSQIRMLEDTEPPLKVKLFKLVIWLQTSRSWPSVGQAHSAGATCDACSPGTPGPPRRGPSS